MKVDVASLNDLNRLIMYAEIFQKESGTKINFDYTKVENTFRLALANKNEYLVLVLRDDIDFVVGVLAAQVITPHFSNDRVAMEWLWYVDPSYRSSKSIQLLKAYLYWAFDVMKCDHATMSTLDSDLADKLHKLYTKIGFSKQENTYIIKRG